MIGRYTREEIGAVWTVERRVQAWLEVELAATDAWADEGVVPPDAARACRERASFTVKAVEERERETGHDVAAFVDVGAAQIGEEGRWLHYGLTSSDVLDTALALQLREAGGIVLNGAGRYRDALIERAIEHRDTLCVGRTHGVHAEPTSFGLRLAGFAFEADRNRMRLERAFEDVRVGKLSGAVGTYASVPPSVERRVMEALDLLPEDVSTQVVPRDRHAELAGAIALAGAGLERFATEVRNLQRTEVREVEEPFTPGQKGSSAMPHKRNPILSERLCGLARLVRANLHAAPEDVALWHERDISHSSVERVILPDSTITVDYMLHLATGIIQGLRVFPERMRANLDATGGLIYSQAVLLALIDKGMGRDDAYAAVQRAADRVWEQGVSLGDDLRPELKGPVRVSPAELRALLDPTPFLRNLEGVFTRLEKLEVSEPTDSAPAVRSKVAPSR